MENAQPAKKWYKRRGMSLTKKLWIAFVSLSLLYLTVDTYRDNIESEIKIQINQEDN